MNFIGKLHCYSVPIDLVILWNFMKTHGFFHDIFLIQIVGGISFLGLNYDIVDYCCLCISMKYPHTMVGSILNTPISRISP